MIKILGAALVLFWSSSHVAVAVEVAFDFTGTVNLFSPVFGLSSSAATNPKTISGTFFYDLSSSISTTSLPCSLTGCANYEQTISSGFQATILSATESVTLRADNYIVQVRNDYTSFGNLRDGLSVIWRSDLTPALDPLQVNGSDQLTGQFRLDLAGLATVFSDASLPATLTWSNFSTLSPVSLIGNTVPLTAGFITLTSLSVHPLPQSDPPITPLPDASVAALPEPSAFAELVIGWCIQLGAFRVLSRYKSLRCITNGFSPPSTASR